ncbi:MAG: GMC family oxidoreductase [Myxococcaceae bacterium]|nr:MAG: GMC family oxidoreductase [Myxococcaceae bacterium]
MDHVFFLSEEQWRSARESKQLDYVVIGSGPCGFAFAERMLQQDPHCRILMIEQGPFFLPDHVQNLPLPYQALRGHVVETYPWKMSARTTAQPAGCIGFQHGMVPFVGGRSLLWSCWSPRPLHSELSAWPPETVQAIEDHLEDAERLLNVVFADELDMKMSPATRERLSKHRPIFGVLQQQLQARLASRLHRIGSATRCMAAPLSVSACHPEDFEFAKYSTPAPLLALAERQAELCQAGKGSALKIMTDCTVTRIHQRDGVATALETSRGRVQLGAARLILAMGTLPPTTLLLNSFPRLRNAGARYTAHFVSFMLARIRREDFAFAEQLAEMELAALYVAGLNARDGMQYHIQLSALSDRQPANNSPRAARYMPDLVATATGAQLEDSQDHVILACSVLGELDFRSRDNWVRKDAQDDPAQNVTLQVLAGEADRQTWDTMDEATFQLLEQVLSPRGPCSVEYWNGTPGKGCWATSRPILEERRMPGLVHEGSTLWIGENEGSVVGPDYRPWGIDNVYVTGGALWPTAGSWNPTVTMVALAQDLADRLGARPGSPQTSKGAGDPLGLQHRIRKPSSVGVPRRR